jgi:hypothetical protein
MRTNGSTGSLDHAAELPPIFRYPNCIADLNLETKYWSGWGLPLFCGWNDSSVAPLTVGNDRQTQLSIASQTSC